MYCQFKVQFTLVKIGCFLISLFTATLSCDNREKPEIKWQLESQSLLQRLPIFSVKQNPKLFKENVYYTELCLDSLRYKCIIDLKDTLLFSVDFNSNNSFLDDSCLFLPSKDSLYYFQRNQTKYAFKIETNITKKQTLLLLYSTQK